MIHITTVISFPGFSVPNLEGWWRWWRRFIGRGAALAPLHLELVSGLSWHLGSQKRPWDSREVFFCFFSGCFWDGVHLLNRRLTHVWQSLCFFCSQIFISLTHHLPLQISNLGVSSKCQLESEGLDRLGTSDLVILVWHRHGGNTPCVGKPPGLLEVGQEMLASTRLGDQRTESSDERS